MKVLKRILSLIIILPCFTGMAQELPPIQNFTPLDYGAENQNWGIAQSQDKLIYVANNEGLLEFNGAKWTLYPSPNETIMRSVRAIGDRIYTGCYMEFGYWQKNVLGVLEYTSLSRELGIELAEDEEFWTILGVDDWVIFQSLNRIYIVDTKQSTVRTIDSEEVIVKMFEVEERIYFQRMDKGIYQIANGEGSLFLDDEIFKSDEIVNLFSDGKGLIILTRNTGFYSYEEGVLKKWEGVNGGLSGLSVYSAIRLRNDHFVLGTISNGLLYLDEDRKVLYEINQGNGLLNNTVLSVFEDADNNIWSGLDNGISYINVNAPIRVFKDKNGRLGSVYASAIHTNNLYFGTNQGLFYKPLADDVAFRMIRGTKGQVWSLKVMDGKLFCGHHNGTFIINGDRAKRVANIQGTWKMDELNGQDGLVIQGNYDGLYILERVNSDWQLKNKIGGFDHSSRHFEVFGDRIFVNHEYKGIFNLTVDDVFSRVVDVGVDTSLKGANSSIATYKGNLLYAYKKGVFTYDEAQNRFVKDSLLSGSYTEADYISGRMVSNEQDDGFWMFTKNNLAFVSSGNLANVPKIEKVPLTLDMRRGVVEYENILNADGLDRYVLGTSSGYLTVDINDLMVEDFDVYISEISGGINQDHSVAKNRVDKSEEGVFASDGNNFRIRFHTPVYYTYFKPTYQFQLLGLYDVWSEWSTASTVFFENLPPGDYTFNVRAKVGEEVSANVASYSFRIRKPWYITNFMLIVYGVVIILLIIFMHNFYKSRYRRQQEKLIEENRKTLELAKLQNEKEIIRIKNEQLEKDYKSKSNELAASTMSIAKKNELLTEIKEQLAKVEEKSGLDPVIRIIDSNLSHDENWAFFKEAFDNADSEFFKKIKELHPNLSPNELKLCAYLRLNLSSKEIAPLFNISPRSVEIKRYRLRKKMNLSNDENLTGYILGV